eukprot:3895937-Rhodomonas_salina.1
MAVEARSADGPAEHEARHGDARCGPAPNQMRSPSWQYAWYRRCAFSGLFRSERSCGGTAMAYGATFWSQCAAAALRPQGWHPGTLTCPWAVRFRPPPQTRPKPDEIKWNHAICGPLTYIVADGSPLLEYGVRC